MVASSALWHSDGVYGPHEVDAPVGMLLIVTLDHLTLVLGVGRGVEVGILKAAMKMFPMSSVAACSTEGLAASNPVTTRLPLAVHLAAAILVEVGESSVSLLLRVPHMTSGEGHVSALIGKGPRLTTKLGLVGLVPAIAKYVWGWGLDASLPLGGGGVIVGLLGVETFF